MTKLYVNTAGDWLKVNASDDWLLVDDETRSADYPTTPAPMEATVTSLAPTYVSITNSLKRQARSRGVQAWGLELRYGAMSRATFAPLWAFLLNQYGQAETFTVSLAAFTPQGAATGTPLVNGGSQTGVLIATDGWTPSTLVLKAGDWIQFENDPKVYSVISDVTANGSGEATIRIFPAIRATPPDNSIIYTDPLFTCALAADTVDVDFDQCLKARGFSIQLQEVL